jgi:uncharacterized iron-regulated membrane protein
MRKRLWMLHSWMGLVSGLGLLLIGLTGSLLVFRTELEVLLKAQAAEEKVVVNPDVRARLDYDTLFQKVRQQMPGREVVAWDTIMFGQGVDAAAVTKAENPREWDWIRVAAATGEVLPDLPESWASPYLEWALKLHYSLLLGDWGIFFAGVLALLLCLLGLSGIYLYRGFWKTLFTLRWRSSARIFFSDLHKMVGISSVVFNLILGLTGAWWNLPVIKELIWGQNGSGQQVQDEKKAEDARPRMYNRQLSINDLVKESVRLLPGLDPNRIYLSLPPRNEHMRLIGSVVPGNPLVGDYNSTIHFHAETGSLLELTDYRHASWWGKFEVMMGPLHFGTFGGLPIKILWCLLGLSPGVLAWTGAMMYWKRRRAIRGKSAARARLKAVDQREAAGTL